MTATAPSRSEALLERDGLLAALAAVDESATAGSGRLVLVGGEAGVGKTALVRRYCEEAGGTVYWGACDPLFAPRPLAPWLDIAEKHTGALSAAVGDGGGAHDVTAAVLEEARRAGRTILVLEDVHWADEATLDTLRLLARKVGSAPLLVLATYRDDGLDRAHPLRLVLGETATGAAVSRLAVPPLSVDAVCELAVAAGFDGAELFRHTSGNPFFVTEVLATGAETIPATVRDAILARAARLDERARAVLDAVAIAPSRIEPWLLDALVPAHADALDACLATGMLVAEGHGVAFRHELARLAIDESLPQHRRVELHRRALEALSSPQAGECDPATLAHHAEAAGDAGAVLRYAPAAAARAEAVGAHREAAAQLARALRFEDRLEPEARAELLRRYADASYLTDRCLDAVAAVQRMVGVYRTLGDRLREGDTLRLLSALQMCPASVLEAEPAGREAVAILETFPPGRPLAAAYANLAAIAMNAEDAEETRAWAARAVELGEELGDVATVAHALNSLGTMEFLLGGPDARGPVERSLELALAEGLEVHVLRAYSNMTWAAWRNRDHVLAGRYLAEGLERCCEPDEDLWRLQLCAHRACVLLEQGRWDEAADSAAQALADPNSSPLPRVLGHTVVGLLRVRRGDPEATAPLDEALELARPSGELQRLGPAAAARAEAAWLAGDTAGVEAATVEALELALRRRSRWVAGQLAVWRRRAGIDEKPPADVAEPWALELEGRVEDAAAAWLDLGCGYDAALAFAQADTEEPLRRALAELERLGARAPAALVAQRLRRLGARVARGPRPRTRANAAGLTPREVEVVRLLADGLRNADIAERLFLSRRTVDHHVSALLRKLAVSTRGGAVARARELDLLAEPQS